MGKTVVKKLINTDHSKRLQRAGIPSWPCCGETIKSLLYLETVQGFNNFEILVCRKENKTYLWLSNGSILILLNDNNISQQNIPKQRLDLE